MKKELYSNMSLFSGIVNPRPEVHETPVIDVLNSSLDSVLNEIFSVDERTGLPKGDIQYYLSKDGNPEIKAWLENNLLKPRAVSSGSSIDDVSDDLIYEMSRHADESSEDYLARLSSIRDEALDNQKHNDE